MALETGTFIDDLVNTNPPGTDPKKEGDDHLRLIKSVLQGTFPDAPRAFHFPNAPAAKTGNYTVVLTDQNALITVDASGAARTVTLPTFASVFAGFSVTVQKSDSSTNTVTVDGNGAETINGATTSVLRARYEAETYTSNGSDWKITRTASAVVTQAEAEAGTATTRRSWTALRVAQAIAALASAGDLAAGDRIFFQQTTPSVNFTKEVSATYDDAGIRLQTGTVVTGGTDAWSVTHTSSKATDSHTLTTTELAAHAHQQRELTTGGGTDTYAKTTGSATPAAFGPTTANTGGGGGHVHTMQTDLKFAEATIGIRD